jgi:signal transduction histidine kinase
MTRFGARRPVPGNGPPLRVHPVAPLAVEEGKQVRSAIGVVLVFREVAERRRMERELRDRAEALAAAGRRRDEFLAMLAHELRNPLAPIRNAFELLRLAGPSEPRLVRGREIIERQVNHQSRMINDLLDVSRITQGKINVYCEPVDLRRLIAETTGDFQPSLQEAGLSLSLEIPDTPVWVSGDITRLTQVFSNLLHNAAKFTERGGRVRVRLAVEGGEKIHRDGQERNGPELPPAPSRTARVPDPVHPGGFPRAVVTVSDTGIGMAPETLDDLFEPFAQADCSLDRSRGGLGLGLALVKGLIELHGGAVQAQSAGLGRGAEFTVWLPLHSSTAAPDPAFTPPASTAAVRVLIIEDNRDAAESLASC